MRGPVVNVTLYLPDGLGSRYPAAVLASKRRRHENMDCMSVGIVEPRASEAREDWGKIGLPIDERYVGLT